MMGPIMNQGSRLFRFGSVSRSSCCIHSHPPKENVGLAETIIGFSAFSLAVLGPAGWFLCHLPSYKKKQKTPFPNKDLEAQICCKYSHFGISLKGEHRLEGQFKTK